MFICYLKKGRKCQTRYSSCRLFADNAVEDVEKLKILPLIACCILNVDGYIRSVKWHEALTIDTIVSDVRTQSNKIQL